MKVLSLCIMICMHWHSECVGLSARGSSGTLCCLWAPFLRQFWECCATFDNGYISPQQSHKGHVAPNVHRRPARPHLDCPVYIYLVFHCCTDPYTTFSFSSLFWMTNNVHIDWWWLLTVGCCFSVCGLLSGNKTFPITYVVQQCTTVFQ